MVRSPEAETTELVLARASFGIVDEECAEDAYGPEPDRAGSWLASDRGLVYSLCPPGVIDLRVRWEAWPFDNTRNAQDSWDRSESTEVDFPSGVLGVDLIDGGWEEAVFSLPGPGCYEVRFAWRFSPEGAPYPSPLEDGGWLGAGGEKWVEELTGADAYCRIRFRPIGGG